MKETHTDIEITAPAEKVWGGVADTHQPPNGSAGALHVEPLYHQDLA